MLNILCLRVFARRVRTKECDTSDISERIKQTNKKKREKRAMLALNQSIPDPAQNSEEQRADARYHSNQPSCRSEFLLEPFYPLLPSELSGASLSVIEQTLRLCLMRASCFRSCQKDERVCYRQLRTSHICQGDAVLVCHKCN